MAAKVNPPMDETEMVKVFIDTQDPPYHERLLGSLGKSFSKIIEQAETLERGLNSGKVIDMTALRTQLELMQQGNVVKKINGKKPERTEGETSFAIEQKRNYTSRAPNFPRYPAPYAYYSNLPQPVYHTQQQSFHPPPSYQSQPTPPPYQNRPSYTQPRFPNQPPPNFPNQRPPNPNPPRKNRNYTNLGKPIEQVYEQLKAAGKIGAIPAPYYPNSPPRGFNPNSTCTYHSGAPGHNAANCQSLQDKIQYMIEAGEIVIRNGGNPAPNVNNNPLPHHEAHVSMIVAEEEMVGATYADYKRIGRMLSAREFIERYAEDIMAGKTQCQPCQASGMMNVSGNTSSANTASSSFILEIQPFELDLSELVVLQLPEQLPVESTHQVPQNYDESSIIVQAKEELKEDNTNTITRSGRFFVTPEMRNTKAVAPLKSSVTEEEVREFLKLMRNEE